MSVKFSLSLFDDDDLKRFEDTMARAMTRAIISALRMASKEGLLLRPEVVREVLQPERPAPEPEPQAPAQEPPPTPEPRVPIFLRPPPDNPFPKGKAVEPPPLKREAKTGPLYQQLYPTVATRPQGYISIGEACDLLGGVKFSGPISTWLQKGELEACIVADEKPTKRLPGRLMISKQSVVNRYANRRVVRTHVAT